MTARVRLGTAAAALASAAACSGASSGPHPSSTPGHRLPPVKTSATAATSAEAARMLHPTDLGSTWRYGLDPGISGGTVNQTPSNGATYVVSTTLGTAHWNGTVWAVDQTVAETATHFGTPQQARHTIGLYVSSPALPASDAKPEHVGRLVVWHRPSAGDKTARTYVLDGATEYYISVSGPSSAGATTVEPAATIVNAALHRIAQPG